MHRTQQQSARESAVYMRVKEPFEPIFNAVMCHLSNVKLPPLFASNDRSICLKPSFPRYERLSLTDF